MGKIDKYKTTTDHIDGLVQDCSNSIANALELLQSCAKPSISNMNHVHISRDVLHKHHLAEMYWFLHAHAIRQYAQLGY